MRNQNDIRRWSTCWKATTSAVHEEPDEKKLADAWDKRWEKRPEMPGPEPDEGAMQKSARETISFLKESGFRPRGSRVLDIGCGPGVLSVPLARLGAEVTALDISPKTLEGIRETAGKEGLKITTMPYSWWSADIDSLGLRNGYDLVIASRTPAINDAGTLERMMACSRDLCYYSSFLNVGGNRAYGEIRKLIPSLMNEDDRRRYAFNAYTMFFPFMYLYFSGYRPLVRLNDTGLKEKRNSREEAQQAIRFFGCGRELDHAVSDKVREYYRHTWNGKTRPMGPSGCHGMMTWKVKEKF